MSLNELQTLTENETSMKMKLFVSHSMDTVEKEVNEWLARETIRVCHVTQSQSEKQGRFVFAISVFYQAIE